MRKSLQSEEVEEDFDPLEQGETVDQEETGEAAVEHNQMEVKINLTQGANVIHQIHRGIVVRLTGFMLKEPGNVKPLLLVQWKTKLHQEPED